MEALEDAGENSKCDFAHQMLCMACLGPGQTLHVLKHQALQLYNTTVNSRQQIIHTVSPRVCWECEILLKKVIRFRERVTECHDILNSSHVTWSEVTRPSRLQIYNPTPIDIPPTTIRSADIKTKMKEELHTEIRDSEYKAAYLDMPPLNAVYITTVEVKQEIKAEVECVFKQPCMACLCGGRTLNGIVDNELKFYMDILLQNQLVCDVSTVSPSPQLCWECCCILKRATRFSGQIRQSYQTVLPLLLARNMEMIPSMACSGVSLPPRLRRCVRDRVDIPPQAHTHDPPPPVKLEKDDPAMEVNQVTHEHTIISTGDTKQNPEGITNAATDKYHCCEVCFKTFPRKYSLKVHMRIHTGEQPYGCIECSKKFSMKGSYDRHMLIHTGEKPYQCSLCLKAFNRKSHLICHIKRHSSVKPFQCYQCSKGFPYKANLERHIKTHSGDKPYMCSHCSKSYTQKAFLKRHVMITHTGEKLLQCSVCSNVFCNQRNLDIHMIRHKDTPYKCKRCSIAFPDAASFDTHVRIHKLKKPHQCSQCSKSFPRKRNLFLHHRTHTGEKPYQCSECSKAFADSSNLVRHTKTHNKSS